MCSPLDFNRLFFVISELVCCAGLGKSNPEMSRATFLDVLEGGSIVARLSHHVDPDGNVFENISLAIASNEL